MEVSDQLHGVAVLSRGEESPLPSRLGGYNPEEDSETSLIKSHFSFLLP